MTGDFDVIVVGAGGSGLSTACSAAQYGARVLVLEKQPQAGGTTGIAVGSFTAAQTSLQRRAGVQDAVDDHILDAGQFAPAPIEARNNETLRAFFLREAAATLEWLRELGVAFVGPHPEPPNRAPRMHNVVPGAKALIAALQLQLHAAGGQLQTNAWVTSLLQDDGRVTGVVVRCGDQSREIRCRRGVVLAAGDYAANANLIAQYKGVGYEQIEGINPYAGGDGHELAQSAGGRLLNMDVTYGPELRFIASRRRPFQQWLPANPSGARIMAGIARYLPRVVMAALIKRLLVTWQHPENALFDDGAILVNQRGERFCNERCWPDREVAVAAQPEKSAYILLDGRLAARYSQWPHFISTAPDIAYAYVADYLRLRPDVAVARSSLQQLAEARRIDAQRLSTTVAEFNGCVRGQRLDPYGRTDDALPLEDAPWILLGPVKAYFTTTEGGVAINQQMQVLDGQSRPIPGLFAVGQNGLGGMILWGHGLHIAWALTSGRLAGKAVMNLELFDCLAHRR